MRNFLKKSFFLGGCLAFCWAVSGCRSVGNDDLKQVDFVSDPESATVFINGKNCGLTPLSESLSRAGSYDVRFSLPGYFDETLTIIPRQNEEGIFDIPDRVEVVLRKISPGALQDAGTRSVEIKTEKADLLSGTKTMSPAAVNFLNRPTPANFAELRLEEGVLRQLLERCSITEEEFRILTARLRDAYRSERE